MVAAAIVLTVSVAGCTKAQIADGLLKGATGAAQSACQEAGNCDLDCGNAGTPAPGSACSRAGIVRHLGT